MTHSLTQGRTEVLPNFLVIGAAKSGTTALYHYLKEHPQIYMSPLQEPKFFSFVNQEQLKFHGIRDQGANAHIIRKLEDYSHLFADWSSEIAIGESSPCYLYYEQTAMNIHEIIPDAKIIAILRNPIDRAYSNFLHMVSSGREPIYDFSQALLVEQERIDKGWEYFWHYKSQGFYSQKIKYYFDLFKHKNIKVLLYEDYKQNSRFVLADIFAFLEVDNTFLPDIAQQYNVTRFPVSKVLNHILNEPHPAKNIVKQLIPKNLRNFGLSQFHSLNSTNKMPPLEKEVRKKLIYEYKEDILQLQNLLQRDLSSWLKLEE